MNWHLSILQNPALSLAVVILTLGGIGFFPLPSLAETVKSPQSETANPSSVRRLRPTFFEETQDPKDRGKGFGNTFLNDALGGVADPLGGTGGAATTVDSLQKVGFNGENEAGQLRSTQQNLSPSFDRSRVIIPSQRGRN